MPALLLEAPGATFGFESDDPPWIDWVSFMWRSFLDGRHGEAGGEAGSFRLQTATDERDKWTLYLDDRFQVSTNDAWLIANQIRFRITTEVIARTSLLPLHAAVLTSRAETVAVVGATGAGKSSLSLELTRRGWHLLADDLALFDDDDLVRPFAAPLSVKDPGAWDEHSAGWSEFPWLPRPSSGFLVDVHPMMEEPPRPRRVTRLVFAQFLEGAPLRLERLTPAAAIVRADAFTGRRDAPALAALRRLCAEVPIHAVEHGGQLADWLSDPVD